MNGSSALGIAGRWVQLRGAVYLQFLMFSADMVLSNVSVGRARERREYNMRQRYGEGEGDGEEEGELSGD